LIKSTWGAHVGYFFAKPPYEIKLVDIIRALEGEICIVEFIENPEICDRNDKCAPQKIWRELNEKIIDTLNSYTLKDLVDIQKAMDKGNTTGPAPK